MSKKSQAKNVVALLALILVLAAAGLLNRLAGPSMAERTGDSFESQAPSVLSPAD